MHLDKTLLTRQVNIMPLMPYHPSVTRSMLTFEETTY